jgi:hypothetical protein
VIVPKGAAERPLSPEIVYESARRRKEGGRL